MWGFKSSRGYGERMTIDELKLQTLKALYELEVIKMMESVDRVNDLKCQMMEVEKRMKDG